MIYLVSKQKNLFESNLYTEMSVEESLKEISSWKMIQFDTEGTGLDCHIAKMLTMQFGNTSKTKQIVVDVTTINPLLYKDILEKGFLIGHNLKYDIKMLFAVGICPTRCYDTMVAEQLRYLAYPKGKYRVSLKETALRYLNKDIDKTIRGQIKYLGLTEEVVQYAANDVVDLVDIMNKQIGYFKSINALKALQIECNFTIPCAYYEFCGVKLNAEKWKKFYEDNLLKFEKATKELNDFVVSLGNPQFIQNVIQLDLFQETDTSPRCNINWNSTDEVVPLLKYLGFNTKGYNKETKEETESKELKLLKKQKKVNPQFVDLFAAYSKLQKLCSTYGLQYINAINPKTGRIHTEFRALGTDTGRLACGSKNTNEDLAVLKNLPLKTDKPEEKCCYPQIQNLPNSEEVRACFIAEEANDFVSIDYNSEESRLLASLSGDKGMLEVFEKGYDMHSYVAYLIYPDKIPRNIDIREIKTKYHDLRQSAKGPEFTFAFLGTWATLVTNYGMPKKEAQEIERNYREGFAGATAYQEMCKKRTESTGIIYICKETGHIAKWWDWAVWVKRQHSQEFWDGYKEAKRRNLETGEPIPEIYEEHFAARSKWDKNAVNSTTQGLGAVIFKQFNYELYKWIIAKGYFNKVKFCVPVHDEICLECPKELTEEVVTKTKYFMESVGALYCHKLPLPAEESVADHWVH